MATSMVLLKRWLSHPQPECVDPVSDRPLDLSCKRESLSSECRSEESRSLGSSGSGDEVCSSFFVSLWRRQRRKEQNKTAAQNYRQRKKTLSEWIEAEHRALIARNRRLSAQRDRLEEQVRRMRSLIQADKPHHRDVERHSLTHQAACWPTISTLATATSTGGRSQTCRERKKEQNKLASRRFRQRRKLEQDSCEREAMELESRNKTLKLTLDQLQHKVAVMRSLVEAQTRRV